MLVTALVSLFAKRSVRADTAMTGKMTLRGLGGGLLAEAAEVEMEVEAISVQRKEAIPVVIKLEPMVVDETVLEIVLGYTLLLSSPAFLPL